jgi:transposase
MVHTMKSEEISASKRRHHERSFKADLILQSLVPGASVSAIALAAGINANSLFKWRRDHQRTIRSPSVNAVTLVPVQLSRAIETAATPVSVNLDSASVDAVANESADVIEVEFAGARLRVRGPVDG